MNVKVASQLFIDMLNNLTSFDHTYLVPLQIGLLANLCICLFIRCHTRLYKATDPGPMRMIAAHTLTTLYDKDTCSVAIIALQKTGDNMRKSQNRCSLLVFLFTHHLSFLS